MTGNALKNMAAICLFLLTAFHLSGQEGNLIKNGNFEEVEGDIPLFWNVTYWDTENPPVFSVSPGREGWAYTIENKTPNDAKIIQMVQVEPGTLYRFSGWIKASGMSASDKGGNLSENAITATSRAVKNTNGQWVYTELVGRTGPNQHNLNLTLRLGGYGHNSKGIASFDDIAFVKLESGEGAVEIVNFFNKPVNQQSSSSAAVQDKKAIPGKVMLLILFVLILIFLALVPGVLKRHFFPAMRGIVPEYWKVSRLLNPSKNAAFGASLVVLFFTWGLFVLFLFGQILLQKNSGIYAGYEHVWSDFPLHFSIASIFAYRAPANWFAHHPLYYGGKMTYPFLMDFISGMLMKGGVPLFWAFVIPSCVFSLLAIYGIYVLAYVVLKSNKAAFITVSLFILSSGLGVYKYLGDFLTTPGYENLFAPETFYSRFEEYQWYSGSIIHGIFMPQRAYLLGMTMALWSLAGLISTMNKEVLDTRGKVKVIFAALGTGLMPIAHMHSFLAIFIVAGFYCLFLMITSPKKILPLFLYYIIPAGILSTILFFTFVGGKTDMGNFFTWFPGFTSKGGLKGWLMMWLKLFGLAVPLAAAGLAFLWKKLTTPERAFFCSFFVLFIAGNLIKFQAVPWDNSKIFYWAYLGFAMLGAAALGRFWKARSWGKIAAVFLFYSLISTGLLDMEKILFGQRKQYQIENYENIALAEKIREETNDLDLFLTSTAHNHFIMAFAARPILMGFTGWIANFGYDPMPREYDMKEMYRGSLRAKELMAKYKISYVVLGGGERQSFKPDENFFRANFPVAFRNRYNTIYDVRGLWNEDVK